MQFLDAKSFLLHLLEHSQDGVLAADAQGQIVVWSPALEQLFGKNKSSAIGQPLFEVLSFLRETGEDWSVREGLAGRAAISRGQKFFLPETGREGWYDARYVPLRNSDGEVVGVLGIFRDRTEAHRLLEQTREETLRRPDGASRGVSPAAKRPGAAPSSLPASPSPSPRRLPPVPPVPRVPPRAARATPPPKPAAAASGPPPAPAESGGDAQIWDRKAALDYAGDPGVLEELIEGFIVSLPEFVREMDDVMARGDMPGLGDHAEDVKKAAEALGGVRAARMASLLATAVKDGDLEEVQPLWWRLRRELAVLREALLTVRKIA